MAWLGVERLGLGLMCRGMQGSGGWSVGASSQVFAQPSVRPQTAPPSAPAASLRTSPQVQVQLRELEGENAALRSELERLDVQNNNLQARGGAAGGGAVGGLWMGCGGRWARGCRWRRTCLAAACLPSTDRPVCICAPLLPP